MSDSIGSKLRALRKGRKLTQDQVAEVIGANRSTISSYESGRRTPNLNQLKRLSEFYGVGLDFFGVATTDEIFDLIVRAKEIFASDEISQEKKNDLWKEIMKLYLTT